MQDAATGRHYLLLQLAPDLYGGGVRQRGHHCTHSAIIIMISMTFKCTIPDLYGGGVRQRGHHCTHSAIIIMISMTFRCTIPDLYGGGVRQRGHHCTHSAIILISMTFKCMGGSENF